MIPTKNVPCGLDEIQRTQSYVEYKCQVAFGMDPVTVFRSAHPRPVGEFMQIKRNSITPHFFFALQKFHLTRRKVAAK
jgi:hypothetical protein